jgi:hypothetical protein
VKDGFERNFYLQPSRILHRISPQNKSLSQKDFVLSGRQFLLLDEALPFASVEPKQPIDVLILSKNPKIYISGLLRSFHLNRLLLMDLYHHGKRPYGRRIVIH